MLLLYPLHRYYQPGCGRNRLPLIIPLFMVLGGSVALGCSYQQRTHWGVWAAMGGEQRRVFTCVPRVLDALSPSFGGRQGVLSTYGLLSTHTQAGHVSLVL
jgi:hypothetical protein